MCTWMSIIKGCNLMMSRMIMIIEQGLQIQIHIQIQIQIQTHIWRKTSVLLVWSAPNVFFFWRNSANFLFCPLFQNQQKTWFQCKLGWKTKIKSPQKMISLSKVFLWLVVRDLQWLQFIASDQVCRQEIMIFLTNILEGQKIIFLFFLHLIGNV